MDERESQVMSSECCGEVERNVHVIRVVISDDDDDDDDEDADAICST